MSSGDMVWIFDEGCSGTVISYGSFFSLVTWDKDGISHEEYISNDEFLLYEKVDDEKN